MHSMKHTYDQFCSLHCTTHVVISPTCLTCPLIESTSWPRQDMADHVAAYQANIARLQEKIVPMGGFYWQMIKGHGPEVRPFHGDGPKHPPRNVSSEECMTRLRQRCVPNPSAWDVAEIYEVRPVEAIDQAEQITAEFLLARGDYAWVGYGWVGCTSEVRPRPALWDQDFGGQPDGPCVETKPGQSGVFTRSYPKATVQWDCNAGKGSITMK